MEALGRDYSDSNRAFLQALLARGSITFAQSQPLLAALANARGSDMRADQVTESDFQDYLSTAASAASFFDYEVRSILHQVSKERIYALVNTQSDPQTQLATIYSAEELAFIKRVLDAMFDQYNTQRMEVMAVTEMQAMKLARPARDSDATAAPDRGLKHGEVETVLASLVDGGWLEHSTAGFYSLTARALLELRPWMVETYNDGADDWQRIKFCEACKDIVTYGLRCGERDCGLRLHDGCQDAFWRARRSTKCPKCERDWTADHYVGERAVTMTEAYRRARRSGRSIPDVVEEASE